MTAPSPTPLQCRLTLTSNHHRRESVDERAPQTHPSRSRIYWNFKAVAVELRAQRQRHILQGRVGRPRPSLIGPRSQEGFEGGQSRPSSSSRRPAVNSNSCFMLQGRGGAQRWVIQSSMQGGMIRATSSGLRTRQSWDIATRRCANIYTVLHALQLLL